MTSSNSPLQSKPPFDPLVLRNRLAVSLSQKRKLVSSWLPPPTADELTHPKSTEDSAADEDEIWTSRPTTLGVGHPIPSSHSITGTYNRENDLLRKRLLGNSMKDARQRHLERTQHRPRSYIEDDASSSDEEEKILSLDKKGTKRRKFILKSNSSGETSAIVDSNATRSGSEDEDDIGGFRSLPVKQTLAKKNKPILEQYAPEPNPPSSVLQPKSNQFSKAGSDAEIELSSPVSRSLTELPSKNYPSKKKMKKKKEEEEEEEETKKRKDSRNES
ncbi:hypothetical protein ABW20_dc0104159 [Dactylellina cionopaga]|nr:hypothetical protein ABW20_dc0104159 [Dactylellina cionopaga]